MSVNKPMAMLFSNKEELKPAVETIKWGAITWFALKLGYEIWRMTHGPDS